MSWQRHLILSCLLLCELALLHAAAPDADALLQLSPLAAGNSLHTWQAGTDPCGGAASCSLGSCSWDHVACEQNQVTQVDLSGLDLHGELPSGWQAPATLKALDLSNNKQLCGSLPKALTRSAGTSIRAVDSGIGQPCSAAPVAGSNKETGGAGTMSSLARGLLGAGVGLGVVAGATAGTLFFLSRKHRRSKEELLSHDLARVRDSVIVTKQKHKRVKAADPSSGPDAGTTGSHPGSSAAEAKGPRQCPELRMVVVTGGFGCGLEDEDSLRQRLRVSNIQDSLVMARSKLEAGLFAQQDELDSDCSTSSGSSQSGRVQCGDEQCGGARVHGAVVPARAFEGGSQQGHQLEPMAEAALGPCEHRHLQPSASKWVQFLGPADVPPS